MWPCDRLLPLVEWVGMPPHNHPLVVCLSRTSIVVSVPYIRIPAISHLLIGAGGIVLCYFSMPTLHKTTGRYETTIVDGNVVKPVVTKMQFRTERKVPKVRVSIVESTTTTADGYPTLISAWS